MSNRCGNLNCQKPASSRCGRCKVILYCSRACQTADWAAHKSMCTTIVEDLKGREPTDEDKKFYRPMDIANKLSPIPEDVLEGKTCLVDLRNI